VTTSSNVSGRSAVRTTPGKLVSIVVTTRPPYGKFSVHDCADPGQASAMNCVYPQNFASPDGITLKVGLVVHTQEPGGVFTVVHST
jgi:hypothetical protein